MDGRYENFESDDVVYLQGNGDRGIGESQTVNMDLPHIGSNPILHGQVHSPMKGQVLLNINGSEQMTIEPFEYSDADCFVPDWKSFMVPLEPSFLQEGANFFTWTIGPRPDCTKDWVWNGFSIKSLEIQFDLHNDQLNLPYIYYLPTIVIDSR